MEKNSEGLEGRGRGQRKLRGAGRGQSKLEGAGRGQEKVGGAILRGAVRDDSLGLCLMCFEVKKRLLKIVTVKVVVRAEILPRDFLQTQRNCQL